MPAVVEIPATQRFSYWHVSPANDRFTFVRRSNARGVMGRGHSIKVCSMANLSCRWRTVFLFLSPAVWLVVATGFWPAVLLATEPVADAPIASESDDADLQRRNELWDSALDLRAADKREEAIAAANKR